jgi:hypothetical protein
MLFVSSTLDQIARDGGVHKTLRLDHCDICYDRKTGHFDESKLQVVPGYLMKLMSVPSNFTIKPGDLGVRPGLRELKGRCTYGGYELRQLIVRSGIYHNDQLSGMRFTEHELSVNAASYKAARSEYVECSCNGLGYGLTNPDRVMEDTPYLILAGDPSIPSSFWDPVPVKDAVVGDDNDSSLLTKVEKAFLQGKDIPTGRRKRSKKSLEKRKRRRSLSPEDRRPKLVVECYPHVPKGFEVEEPYMLPCEGKAISLSFPQIGIVRKNARRRKPKPRVIRGRTLPPKEKSKYWYFLRTKGKWNYSLHNPYGSDPVSISGKASA